jgi:hypothetical protein
LEIDNGPYKGWFIITIFNYLIIGFNPTKSNGIIQIVQQIPLRVTASDELPTSEPKTTQTTLITA